MTRRILAIAVMLLFAAAFPEGTSAQAAPLCFPGVPGINFCIEGRFREYWLQTGGLPVFGYPISPVVPIVDEETGTSYVVQCFERTCFEHHPEQARPYDVLLLRLGDFMLVLDYGVEWQTQPRDPAPVPGCRWFTETSFNVCDAAPNLGFQSYWQSHGLEFDGQRGTSYAESLALFGLPLTPAFVALNASGDEVQMQWFERARFEWHPNNPPEHRVLLGLLGTEFLTWASEEAPQEPLSTSAINRGFTTAYGRANRSAATSSDDHGPAAGAESARYGRPGYLQLR